MARHGLVRQCFGNLDKPLAVTEHVNLLGLSVHALPDWLLLQFNINSEESEFCRKVRKLGLLQNLPKF
jgi:hypothetical protein